MNLKLDTTPAISRGAWFFVFVFFFDVLFMLERDGDRAREQRRGREREENTIRSGFQALNRQPSSHPGTVKSWPERKSDAKPTEPPRRPHDYFQLGYSQSSFSSGNYVDNSIGYKKGPPHCLLFQKVPVSRLVMTLM